MHKIIICFYITSMIIPCKNSKIKRRETHGLLLWKIIKKNVKYFEKWSAQTENRQRLNDNGINTWIV